MNIEICEFTQDEVQALDMSEFELWWDDWDEAAIRRCWLAMDGSKIVGFLTRDGDFNCVAVEVLPAYRRQGVASDLCDESNTYFPRDDYKPEFWAAMKQLAEVAA